MIRGWGFGISAITGVKSQIPNPKSLVPSRRRPSRLSILERYPTIDAYLQAVTRSARALRDARFLLDEDVGRIVMSAKLRADMWRPARPPTTKCSSSPLMKGYLRTRPCEPHQTWFTRIDDHIVYLIVRTDPDKVTPNKSEAES